MNDPFGGGMHIPDIYVVKPVFWEGEIVCFAVTTAHHLDLGGRLPGSSACDNTEIFQEGLRIPWLKLHHRGDPDEAIFALLRTNVRVPEKTVGDLRAQVAACNIGEQAVRRLIVRYGAETLSACGDDLIDYTEELIRAEIASWPDGTSTFVDYMDSDGVGGPRVRFQVTVTIEDDTFTADFRGTDPQVRGALNSTRSFTCGAVAVCVRCAMSGDVPNTAGMFRPLNIITEPGTVAEVVMPGASSMRGVTGFRMVDTIFGAMAGLLPDRILAAGEGGNTLVVFGGRHRDRSPYIYYESVTGTWGGRPGMDGNRWSLQSHRRGQQHPGGAGGSRIPGANSALRPGGGYRRTWKIQRRIGRGTGVGTAGGAKPISRYAPTVAIISPTAYAPGNREKVRSTSSTERTAAKKCSRS